ncbi:site-specific integrase [Hansschlegelia plantiphila]|uniref:site-specific integrase n=1 Tax=Hansschlegelia plantiphila TaxID=374655 RepID=UPI0032047A0D
MTGKVRHLAIRQGRYWARVVVPADVVAAIGSTELREPLGGEYAVALRKLPAAVAQFHQRIDHARAAVKANAALTISPNRPLTDRQIAMVHFAEEEELDSAARLTSDREAVGDFSLFRPAYVDLLKRIVSGRATNEEMGAGIGWAVDKFVSRGNAAVARGTLEWRHLCMSLASIHLETIQCGERRDEGEDPGDPKHPLLRPAPQLVVNDPRSARAAGMRPEHQKTFLEIVALAIEEKRPRPATANEFRVAGRMLAEHLGEPTPIYRITKSDIISYKRALQETPSNYVQRFPGSTISEAIKANKARAAPFPTLEASTINNKWLAHIRSIFAWAAKNEIIPDNPASNVHVDRSEDGKGPPRIPFSTSDLAKIFSTPLFAASTDFGERPWAILIGLYTGMRAAEIAQLTIDAVRRERGVLVFEVGGELKNEASRRLVPVHSTLIRLGLEQRIERLKKSGKTHILPDWHDRGKAQGDEAQSFSQHLPRWFNRTFLPSCGITDKRKVFHSLRHSLKTALSSAGVDRGLSDRITGHEDSSAGGRYIHQASVEAMRDALEKVDFGDVIKLTR